MFTRSIRLPIAVVVAGLLLIGFGGWAGSQSVHSAQAASSLGKGVAAQDTGLVSHSSIRTPAGLQRFTCTITEVGTGTISVYNYVVVGCSPPDGTIKFFATDTSDWKRSARFLSVALTAQATGKTVYVDYDPSDVTGVPCDVNGGCREMLTIGIGTTP